MSNSNSFGKDNSATTEKGLLIKMLDKLEWIGNKLPDPAVLFIIGILTVWVLSAILSSQGIQFQVPGDAKPRVVENLLSLKAFSTFLSGMVKEFTSFHPLGVVLVALLGVGIAEHAGLINAVLKSLLSITPNMLLTPMLIFVALISHTAADAGYVLVIPIGGVMFYAAGRHPLAGIAAAFAGVSGGFSANVFISGIDPLLAGLTKEGTKILSEQSISPLCNYYFTASSSIVIVLVGWAITAWVIESKLKGAVVDGDPKDMPKMVDLSQRDITGMIAALVVALTMIGLVVAWAVPEASSLRDADTNSLTKNTAPLMEGIVPLIFFLFAVPGMVHGFVVGTFKSHRDVIKAMAKSMETMGYYLVLVFFAALFIESFKRSNIGSWLAVSGAEGLQSSGAPVWLIIIGIIVLTSMVNLLIGSASAKWAMLSPIFVPMMMIMGISPEMTQAAYRIGDSTTNIITPMMPYFPLVVVFCQKYVKNTGIGTVVSMMLPYSFAFLVCWSIYLMIYWQIGFELGPDVKYEYVP
ncbi:MAG: AbgT family transporter [Pirellulales bacterium]